MQTGVSQRFNKAVLERLREHDQIMWTEPVSTLLACQHRLVASKLAETQLIAANSAANILYY
jgi:hypothetical protein